MPTNLNTEIAIAYAWTFIGKWYKWAGDDPSGFDCSGFIVEVLKSIGKVQRNADHTAKQLFDMFPKVQNPSRGCLVFWHDGNKNICHVELMITDKLSIGASGGGSKTLTEQDAIRDNAFIKIRLCSFDFLGVHIL